MTILRIFKSINKFKNRYLDKILEIPWNFGSYCNPVLKPFKRLRNKTLWSPASVSFFKKSPMGNMINISNESPDSSGFFISVAAREALFKIWDITQKIVRRCQKRSVIDVRVLNVNAKKSDEKVRVYV